MLYARVRNLYYEDKADGVVEIFLHKVRQLEAAESRRNAVTEYLRSQYTKSEFLSVRFYEWTDWKFYLEVHTTEPRSLAQYEINMSLTPIEPEPGEKTRQYKVMYYRIPLNGKVLFRPITTVT